MRPWPLGKALSGADVGKCRGIGSLISDKPGLLFLPVEKNWAVVQVWEMEGVVSIFSMVCLCAFERCFCWVCSRRVLSHCTSEHPWSIPKPLVDTVTQHNTKTSSHEQTLLPILLRLCQYFCQHLSGCLFIFLTDTVIPSEINSMFTMFVFKTLCTQRNVFGLKASLHLSKATQRAFRPTAVLWPLHRALHHETLLLMRQISFPVDHPF